MIKIQVKQALKTDTIRKINFICFEFFCPVSAWETGCNVASWLYRQDTVVFAETLESFCYVPAATFYDLRYNSPCVIEPDLSGHAAYVLKYGNQTFQQAFHIFSIIKLEKAAVTVWEAEYKIFCFVVEFPIFVKICCTEIGLCFTWSVLKRNVTS